MLSLRPGKTICAVFLLCTAAAISSPAQTFTILGTVGSMRSPASYGPLVQGLDGNLYGVTTGGNGTIFQLTTSGVVTTLHTFNGSDGLHPSGGLIVSPSGILYGTTGSNADNFRGTVFSITTAGHLVNLHQFCVVTGCPDGVFPLAGLFLANNGFWGTTAGGDGTIFNISPSGVFRSVFSFNGTDGQSPAAPLIQGINNNFYGGTQTTLFEITSGGTLTTIHTFTGPDGDALSPAQLVLGPKGIFYGTTMGGGAHKNACVQPGCGTIFEISPGGHTFIQLHRFTGTDGFQPDGLVLANDGNFYGVTFSGGANRGPAGAGTIFQLKPDGTFTTLYNFCPQTNCPDGIKPLGLMQATDGNFYGTTQFGGVSQFEGVAFKFSMGLSPFVTTIPTARGTGGKVVILGTDLSGASSVTFNGTPAVFTVVSPTEITTTVPAGATPGNVEVVTPSGTLVSNVPFRAN